MFESEPLTTEHKDLIHDVAYDYYGQRFATCSSDQHIKVWDKNEDEEWKVTSSWKAHTGSVWRLSWAHPEFGQILASCSFDRTVSVWEEVSATSPTSGSPVRWLRRTNLVDSRTNVTSCKFGPKSLGLVLATTSADGNIRIYEAPDFLNLSQWTLQHEIDCKMALSCLSWNDSLYRLHNPLIAVGSDDTSGVTGAGGKVFIYEYSENSRRWAKTETINVQEEVHDVAFAPSLGRSFHILAVASKELHIYNLKPILDPTSSVRMEVTPAKQVSDQAVSDRPTSFWRVTWNITGTILASTGEDGYIRLWKSNYLKSWRCVCVFTPQSQAAALPEGLTSIHDKPQQQQQQQQQPSTSSNATKYYKKGTISHPSQVPWH